MRMRKSHQNDFGGVYSICMVFQIVVSRLLDDWYKSVSLFLARSMS